MAEQKRRGIGEILVENGLISFEQLELGLKAQKESGERLGEVLINLGYIDQEVLLEALGNQNKVKVKEIDDKNLKVDILSILSEDYMRKKVVMPLRINGNKLTIAMENPKDQFLIDELQMKTNMLIKPVMGMKSNIIEYLDKHIHVKDEKTQHQTDSALDELNKFAVDENNVVAEGSIVEDITNTLASNSAPIVKGVNAIIVKAVQLGVSDIHIEPYEKEIRIRYRIDGVLTVEKTMPKHIMEAIVSRIKIMSNLNISEKRLPQDGRFRLRVSGRNVDFRISILKMVHGEKVVMRILDKGAVNLKLPTLGYDEEARETINRILNDPYGIILVTGPTGSGKSTTLYSLLDILNTPDANISTAEDPVEYELSGINQVQCKPDIGLTFSATLRSFLRQDPDVIMVGEIRDGETAEISIKAALTGHLVLSTLHTNDAPSSIHRLINMGIESFLISASVSMIIAQRLVRKICEYCKTEDTGSNQKILSMNLDPENYKEAKFLVGAGCDKCNGTGYKGRSVIYEILEVDDVMKTFIATATTSIEIKKFAIERGMATLRDCGIKKAMLGVTSLEEVMRATVS